MSRWLSQILLVIILMTGTNCARQSGEPVQFVTGTVITRTDIISALASSGVQKTIFGKNTYAPITEEWLLWNYSQFRSKINDNLLWGVTGWDNAVTCTWFTTRFNDEVQQSYFRRAFHNNISQKTSSPAVGEFWYHPGGNFADGKPNHSIVICFTEKGLRFFEPQTGKFVILTNAEIESGSYLNIKFN